MRVASCVFNLSVAIKLHAVLGEKMQRKFGALMREIKAPFVTLL